MYQLNNLCKSALLMTLMILGQTASAHTDEFLDTQTAPHGGQLRMAGPYHYELVLKTNELTLYLTDHAGTKIASTGASGTAVVLSSKGKASIKLNPAGDNMIRGSGQFEAVPDMKIAVSIALPGQEAQQARFVPLKKALPPANKSEKSK